MHDYQPSPCAESYIHHREPSFKHLLFRLIARCNTRCNDSDHDACNQRVCKRDKYETSPHL